MTEEKLAELLEPLWPELRIHMERTILRFAATASPEVAGVAAAIGQTVIDELSRLAISPTPLPTPKARRLKQHNPHANR